jgi:hypothetical protein
MSRPATRQLSWQFVLRTLKRIDMIAARYQAEDIARWLIDDGVYEMPCPDAFLADIWDCMQDRLKELGRDPYQNPNRKHDKCAACGSEIMQEHNGAIYCSTRCRQRAYRERKAKAEGRNSPLPKRRSLVLERRLKERERETERILKPLQDAAYLAAVYRKVAQEAFKAEKRDDDA